MGKGDESSAYARLIRMQEQQVQVAARRSSARPSSARNSICSSPVMTRNSSYGRSPYYYSARGVSDLDDIHHHHHHHHHHRGGGGRHGLGSFLRLAKMNSPEWGYALVGSIGSMVCCFLSAIFAYVLSVYYDPSPAAERREIAKYCYLLVGMSSAALVFNAVQHVFWDAVGENLSKRVRERISSSMEKFYPIDSPLKKRKSRHELIDPRLLSLKYKFGKRVSRQDDDESAKTESLGCDGFLITNNCSTDMVSIPEEVDSCENTVSLFGGCIEVDSKNGIESQSMMKMFEARASGSSSSSNIFSSDASYSCSTGTKETDSWVMNDDGSYPALILQPHDNDLDQMYEVLEQYGDLMDGEQASGDVHGSASRIMDEKLYSNGVDDFQILPTGPTGSHGEKKLTIDQEFEQYFSRLML